MFKNTSKEIPDIPRREPGPRLGPRLGPLSFFLGRGMEPLSFKINR